MSFWQARAKVDTADREFSKFIRERDNHTCQACGANPPEGHGLECSHFWGRVKESTRFDPENCDTLCKRCHAAFETEKAEGREYWLWKIKRLGSDRFNALAARAHTHVKKDRRMSLICVRAWMAELKKNRPQVLGEKA